MSENVISVVAAHPKLMPVFHIPAQSGDDEVLARMGRGYTAQRYLEIVHKIREKIPGACAAGCGAACARCAAAATARLLLLRGSSARQPAAARSAALSRMPLSSLPPPHAGPSAGPHCACGTHTHARVRARARADAAITSDFIVGTPGETDAQFEATLELMRKVKFDASMTAAYSPRPNTPMALWDGQLSEEVKEARLAQINRLVAEHALELAQRLVGNDEEVLVEERNTKRPEQVIGRTRSNRLVFFAGDIDELRGRLVTVRITEARKFSLTGELVASGPAPSH